MRDNLSLYSCIDAAVPIKIWNSIKDDVDALGYTDIYRQTIDLYGPCAFMQTKGLRVDIERLEYERSRVREEIGNKQAELDVVTNGAVNPLSPKSCQAYFYGTLGLQPYTNDGKITTDDTAISRIFRKGHPEAKLVQDIRRLNKLHSTYLEVQLDIDNRLRCSWNLRGTREGRLSSSQTVAGIGLNFQNLHPDFKSFIVPDEDHLFIEIDKRQAEWVVTAFLSGDARMIQVIEEGLDPHLYTASLITGAPIEILAKEAKIVGHHTDPDTIFQLRMEQCKELIDAAGFLPRSMSCRQAGKKGNHALNYKEGYRKFALINEMPESDAEPIVNGYRKGYCNLPIWWEQTENELRTNNRTLVNCFGRPRRFLGEWNDALIRTAVAYKPQSTVVDLVNRGMIAIYNDIRTYMRILMLGAQVHDSILFQFPIDMWEPLARACLRCHDHLNPTILYGGREFTIDSEVKIGYNWGEYNMKTNPKGMKEVPFKRVPSELAYELENSHAATE